VLVRAKHAQPAPIFSRCGQVLLHIINRMAIFTIGKQATMKLISLFEKL